MSDLLRMNELLRDLLTYLESGTHHFQHRDQLKRKLSESFGYVERLERDLAAAREEAAQWHRRSQQTDDERLRAALAEREQMQRERDALREERDLVKAMHNVAVRQRDAREHELRGVERERDALAAQLAALREAAEAFAGTAPGPSEVCDGCAGSGDTHESYCVRAPLDRALADTAPAAEAYTRSVQAEALESTGIRREVLAFARIMEARLRAHDDRGSRGWVECEPKWLLKRLREETKELQEAIERKTCGCRSVGECMHGLAALGIDGQHEEAADVANFAMMIADVCGYLDENADNARAAEIRGGR